MENQITIQKQINFKNEKCIFTFDLESKEISGDDLTDNWNAPRCYNKTSKSFKKALKAVNDNFNADLSMYQVINIITNAGIKMRSYCSND